MPEFASKTLAVLRAELGDVDRFTCSSQAVAYAGLDIQVKQSGKSKGQAKLSKRGSGRIRRILYMAVVRCIRLKDSADVRLLSSSGGSRLTQACRHDGRHA